MSFGSQKQSSSSKPVDLTPGAFSALQAPFADVLAGLLGFNQTTTTTTPAPAPARPTSFGSVQRNVTPKQTGPHDPGREQFQSFGDLFRFLSPQQQAQPTTTTSYTSPARSGNALLSGLPKYEGALSAPIGANEQTLLDRLMGMATGSATSPAGSALEAALRGEGIGGYTGYSPSSTLEGFAQTLQGAAQTEGYSPDQNNPFVQAAIEAAQRPTFQALEETLSRTLPGRFTAAGQFTQPRGSSAFDRAAAIASRGAGQTAADIATNISFGAFEAERGRQFQAEEGARSRESEALAQELERRGSFEEAARMRADAARERQLAAAQALPQVNAQEVDTMVKNLQAQALPRLIQELGIERGLELFQNRVNTLMQALGITAGVTSPVIGQTSSSKGSQVNAGIPLGSK